MLITNAIFFIGKPTIAKVGIIIKNSNNNNNNNNNNKFQSCPQGLDILTICYNQEEVSVNTAEEEVEQEGEEEKGDKKEADQS